MPVIDIHEHMAIRRVYLDEAYRLELITMDELVAMMDRHGIDQSVILPVTSPETFMYTQPVEEVAEAMKKYPGRFILFCNVDPRLHRNDPDCDFVPLLEYYKTLGAKGLGEITCNLFWDDPRVQNLLGACEKTDLPIIFHQAPYEFKSYGLIDLRPGLSGLERALQRFPGLQILGHSSDFWCEIGPLEAGRRGGAPNGNVEPGGRVPNLMRRYPNLHGDLSGPSGYNAVSRDPEWTYDFIEEFQDRLFMGVDVCVANDDRCKLLTFLRDAEASGKISRQAFRKVMGDNAVRLLNL